MSETMMKADVLKSVSQASGPIHLQVNLMGNTHFIQVQKKAVMDWLKKGLDTAWGSEDTCLEVVQSNGGVYIYDYYDLKVS